LRSIAGIWPYGYGSITFPLHDKIIFIPQKPYCPPGSLRHCIAYPFRGSSSKNDDNINRLLHLCQLQSLCNHDLDEIQDWSRILSLGEQQKLSFVRVFLHKPKWIFLDEATSSLDQQSETYLYMTLFEQLGDYSTVISVGHRSNLRRFHQIELIFRNGQIDIN
jgi:putative ATP-binding cassette transporter